MLENLGERIANLGNSVASGASNIMENTKRGVSTFSENVAQKNKIEAARTDLKNAYQVIGEKFYNENRENVPSGYEAAFAKIETSIQDIADAEEEIRRINGVEVCPGCGTNVKREFAFCTNCGHKMIQPKPQEENRIHCRACGKMLAAASAFCFYCGEKGAEEEAPMAEPKSEPVCAGCGNKLNEGAVFCNMCGAAVK